MIHFIRFEVYYFQIQKRHLNYYNQKGLVIKHLITKQPPLHSNDFMFYMSVKHIIQNQT